MATTYEEDYNSGIDDSAASQKCLNVLGKKLGILAGHKRPQASYWVVGSQHDRFFNHAWHENSKRVSIALKEGEYSEDAISEMDDAAMDDAYQVAKEEVTAYFGLSNQQLDRYLKKYNYWMDRNRSKPSKG